MKFEDGVTREVATTWDDLWKLYHDKFQQPDPLWVFRGLTKFDSKLETTLERAAKRFGVDFTDLPNLEDGLLRHFKRQAHRYLTHLPQADDPIQWLALMRHYGAPTRLMDWTFSFFVAVYFAVEEAKDACAVWALDLNWLRKRAEGRFPGEVKKIKERDPHLKGEEFFNCVFKGQPPLDLVYSLSWVSA